MAAQAFSVAATARLMARLASGVAAMVLTPDIVLAQRGSDGLDARGRAAYAQWRKLAQSEVNCINDALRAQRTTLWRLIERGTDPSSNAVAAVRAACRGDSTRMRTATVSDRTAALALAAPAAKPRPLNTSTNSTVVAPNSPPAAAPTAESRASTAAAAPTLAPPMVFGEPVDAAEPLKLGAVEPTAARRALANLAIAEKAVVPDLPATAAPMREPERGEPAKPVAVSAVDRPSALSRSAVDHQPTDKPSNAPPEPFDRSVLAFAAAEARTSFIYGLMTGPLLLALGGFACLFMQRRRAPAADSTDADTRNGAAGVI